MQHTLKNIGGLPCLFIPMQDVNSVTVQVFVKAGSVYETATNNGVAHLLEHMFFKGGKKYQTPKDVAAAVEHVGGEFNAYTSSMYAAYYVKVAPAYVRAALDVLADMMVDAQFSDPELQREKQVVLQEIAMYEDEPQELVSDKRKQWRYGDTSYGRPILGTATTLAAMDQSSLFVYKKALYTKDNMLLTIAGARDEPAIETMIAELFGTLPATTTLQKPSLAFNVPSVQHAFFAKQTQQNHLIISAQGHRWTDVDRFHAKVLMTIVGGNMSSRLYQNIREKQGLCYYIGGTHMANAEDGTYYMRAGIDKARFAFGVDKIYEELDLLVRYGFTSEEFAHAVGYTIGQMQIGLEGTDEVAQFFGPQQLLYNQIYTLPQITDIYKNMQPDQVSVLLPRLARENLYLYHVE